MTRTKAPSIGSTRALRLERTGRRARFHTSTDWSSTLVACREPRQPRQGRGGRFKLPRAPTRLSAHRAVAEKMLLPDVCNRPTERAPLGGFDSSPRRPSPSGRAIPRTRTHAAEVELRLTATLQLRASSLIVSRIVEGRASSEVVDEAPLGPGGRCDRQPLRRCPPGRGVFFRWPGWRRDL